MTITIELQKIVERLKLKIREPYVKCERRDILDALKVIHQLDYELAEANRLLVLHRIRKLEEVDYVDRNCDD